jgi:tetratricopeptide (TPR) repeat protein
MPKWSPGGSEGILNTPARQDSVLPPPPKIDVGVSKSFEDQFAKRLDEMARQAKGAPSAQPGLVVDQVGHTTTLIAQGVDGKAGQQTAKLDEARRLIGEKKYREALTPIDEVLRESPSLPDARYLRALCQFSMGELEPALECLDQMARAGLDGQFESRLRLLRTQIREQLTPPVVLETALMTAVGQADAALARLDRLIMLDPDGAIFHLLRAHTLLLGNRLADAARAARQAEPHCHGGDREALQALSREIELRELKEKLKPAREYFRSWQYRKARASMEVYRSQYGKHSLWTTFHGYLEALGGGLLSKGRSPQELGPLGSPKELDELYFFLVQKEIQAAKPLMNTKDFVGAEQALEPALQFAPRFPYLNFLLALCAHESLGQSAEAKKPPPLQEALARMKKAREFAQAAIPDPEIENAPELLAAIDQVLEMLEAVTADSALIDPLAGRFQTLMTELTSGKPTREKLVRFLAGVNALRLDVDRAHAGCRSDSGRTNLAELKATIDDVRKQLSPGGR